MHGIASVVTRTSEDDDARDAGGDAAGSHRLAELLLPALYASLAQLPQDPRALIAHNEAEHVADGWRSGAIGMTQRATPTSSSLPAGGASEGAAGAGGPA